MFTPGHGGVARQDTPESDALPGLQARGRRATKKMHRCARARIRSRATQRMPLRVATITSRGCAQPGRGVSGNLVGMNGQQLARRFLADRPDRGSQNFRARGRALRGGGPILDGMSPAPCCLYSTVATISALLSSALLLAACPGSAPTGDTSADGSSTGDAPQDPTTSSSGSSTGGPPDDSGDPAAFFVPGRDGDAAYVLRVSPATGEVTPYGPALPAAADQLGYFQDVLPSPDGSRVVVRVWLVPDGPRPGRAP